MPPCRRILGGRAASGEGCCCGWELLRGSMGGLEGLAVAQAQEVPGPSSQPSPGDSLLPPPHMLAHAQATPIPGQTRHVWWLCPHFLLRKQVSRRGYSLAKVTQGRKGSARRKSSSTGSHRPSLPGRCTPACWQVPQLPALLGRLRHILRSQAGTGMAFPGAKEAPSRSGFLLGTVVHACHPSTSGG